MSHSISTHLDHLHILTQSPRNSTLIHIALRAGELIMGHYTDDQLKVNTKSDSSPVTIADELANDLIVDGLRELTPNIPIVAEESVAHGELPQLPLSTFWLVDPLDGTKEFIKKNGDFTVNIALIEDGVPVLGVVYLPAQGVLYFGQHQLGAVKGTYDKDWSESVHHEWREEMEDTDFTPPPDNVDQTMGNSVQHLPSTSWSTLSARTPPEIPKVMVSRSHPSPETLSFLETYPEHTAEGRGSSLKFCIIAEGEADYYPRFGRTMEWDTAAGHAVLLAAGGDVVTIEGGTSLIYGKEGFENPNFLAFGLGGPLGIS